jgi:purine-binding chemotaxis protein CheW
MTLDARSSPQQSDDSSTAGQRVLVCRAGGALCVLPLEHVTETMRPLAVTPINGVPGPIAGVAVVRGEPVPVVNLSAAIAGDPPAPTRFVTVRAGHRIVALAVDEVVGVRTIPSDALSMLPPLVRPGDGDGAFESLGTLDGELLIVLRSSHLVSGAAWAQLEQSGALR